MVDKLTQQSKYFQADRITEVTYKRQANDYFERFTREIGRTISKQGHPVYTSFNLWAHPPTLKHPDFTIKIQLGNKKGGSTFSQMTVLEFDQLISDIFEWRQRFDKEIQIALHTSLELKRRRHIQSSIGNILEDTTLPTDIIEQALEEKYLTPTPVTIDLSSLAGQFVKTYIQYLNATDQLTRNYYSDKMRTLLPNDLDDLGKFKELVKQGLDGSVAYKAILASNSIESDGNYLENPTVDIDWQKLYHTENDLQAGEECENASEDCETYPEDSTE